MALFILPVYLQNPAPTRRPPDTPLMDFFRLLSPELVDMIMNEADNDTLLNLRRTCKTLCYHATPTVFRHVDVWLEKGSLQKLVNIAKAPHLSIHVKHVSCGMEEFYDIDFDDFKSQIWNGTIDENSKPDETSQRASYHVYRRYARQQTALRDGGEDLSMMAIALYGLTALVSADITDHYFKPGGDGPKLLEREPLLRQWMLSPDYVLTPRGGYQLRVVLVALALAERQLEDLSLRLYEGYIGGSGGLLSPFHSVDGQLARPALSSLRKLYLKLPGMHVSTYKKKNSQLLSITMILQAAKKLECLSLDLPDFDDDDPTPGASWNDLFGTSKIGNLKELDISYLTVREAEFTNFLSQSCSDLRALVLDHARLTEGSWGSMFEKVRRLQHLEFVDLASLRYDYERGFFLVQLSGRVNPDREGLYEYLCNRRHVNPWPQIIKKEFEIMEEEDREDEEYELWCEQREIEKQRQIEEQSQLDSQLHNVS
ncbi:hypothetical protein MMC28_001496 [Mycoblastus sanguinarius]|nr:hypothetical protein [Mycoblastus sanguinarius]